MLLKLICCDVFTRVACQMVATSSHVVDPEFVCMLAHVEPQKLREDLQIRIDRCVTERPYDAIILGYGICGNAISGLTAPIPLIIPRVHDCCSLFMGSRDAFTKGFGDSLSTRWCSNGYYERCHALSTDIQGDQLKLYTSSSEYQDLVSQYGEENAEYVWQVMHPEMETDEAIYIELEGLEYSNSLNVFKDTIEKQDKTLRILKGDTNFIRKLIHGEWDESLFLTLQPGQKAHPLYDMHIVITSKDI